MARAHTQDGTHLVSESDCRRILDDRTNRFVLDGRSAAGGTGARVCNSRGDRPLTWRMFRGFARLVKEPDRLFGLSGVFETKAAGGRRTVDEARRKIEPDGEARFIVRKSGDLIGNTGNHDCTCAFAPRPGDRYCVLEPLEVAEGSHPVGDESAMLACGGDFDAQPAKHLRLRRVGQRASSVCDPWVLVVTIDLINSGTTPCFVERFELRDVAGAHPPLRIRAALRRGERQLGFGVLKVPPTEVVQGCLTFAPPRSADWRVHAVMLRK